MKPKVSLLIAMRNEEQFIRACLESILSQDYGVENIEILVADGLSADRSAEIVNELLRDRPNCFVLENLARIQSAGWNLGISRATGDIIGIVSAHSELDPTYVSTAVETLQRTGAEMVGGPMRARGAQSRVAKAIAAATSHPFGVGGARFHYLHREEAVDTVYMGLCCAEVWGRIGGFDEQLVRNQDDELSYRLRKLGGTIICNPAIKSYYHNRATLRTLARQYYQYGLWKIRLMQKHPRQMQIRHFVPALFVLSLLVSLLIAPFSSSGQWVFVAIVLSYLVANAAASFAVARESGREILSLLPLVFMILHLSYGSGFLVGLAKFRNWWGRNSEQIRKTRTLTQQQLPGESKARFPYC